MVLKKVKETKKIHQNAYRLRIPKNPRTLDENLNMQYI